MFFCSSTDGRVLCIDRQSGICSRHVCIECHVPEKISGSQERFCQRLRKTTGSGRRYGCCGMDRILWTTSSGADPYRVSGCFCNSGSTGISDFVCDRYENNGGTDAAVPDGKLCGESATDPESISIKIGMGFP